MWAALDACTNDAHFAKQEEEADELAMQVLKSQGRAIQNDLAFEGFSAIYSWLLWTAGQAASIERGNRFCAYMQAPEEFSLPAYRGTHPRLAARSARIAKVTGVLDAPALEMNARLDDLWAETFCKEAEAFKAGKLDCSQPPGEFKPVKLKDGTIMKLIPGAAALPKAQAMPTGTPVLSERLTKTVCESTPMQCPLANDQLTRCRNGSTTACNSLAVMIERAGDAEQDAATLRYFACLRNDASACSFLGGLLELGLARADHRLDAVSARKWYLRGCTLGDGDGCISAADLYYNTTKMNAPRLYALGLLAQGCKLGNAKSCQRQNELMAIREHLRRTTKLPFAFLPYEQIPTR